MCEITSHHHESWAHYSSSLTNWRSHSDLLLFDVVPFLSFLIRNQHWIWSNTCRNDRPVSWRTWNVLPAEWHHCFQLHGTLGCSERRIFYSFWWIPEWCASKFFFRVVEERVWIKYDLNYWLISCRISPSTRFRWKANQRWVVPGFSPRAWQNHLAILAVSFKRSTDSLA